MYKLEFQGIRCPLPLSLPSPKIKKRKFILALLPPKRDNQECTSVLFDTEHTQATPTRFELYCALAMINDEVVRRSQFVSSKALIYKNREEIVRSLIFN